MGYDGTSLVGQVLGDTYRVERELGGGGMGAVYEASHLRLRRHFAIKVLFPKVAANEEALARFQREAQITSSLGHPHIVEVIDFNHAPDGSPYIVMELLEGRDLEGLLQERGPLPLERVATIFGQVAGALLAAHEQGIIHRDLKPSNVFLCDKAGQRDVVKVVDFGISKVLGSKSVVTRTQATMGTPGYMSPEQAEGRAAEVDIRTDVFAMGTMLYEMLSGRPPFAGESIPTMLYKIVHQPPPPLRGVCPGIPAEIEVVVHRALEKSPEDRFPSMEEMVVALGEALAGTSAELRGSLLSAAGVSMTAPMAGSMVSASSERVAVSKPVARPKGGATTLSSSAAELELKRQQSARLLWVALALVVLLATVATAAILLREERPEVATKFVEEQPATPPPPVETPAPAPRPPRQLLVEVVAEGKGLRKAGCSLYPVGGAERVARALPCRFKVLEGTEVRLELRRGRKHVSRSFKVSAARRFAARYRARRLLLAEADPKPVAAKPKPPKPVAAKPKPPKPVAAKPKPPKPKPPKPKPPKPKPPKPPKPAPAGERAKPGPKKKDDWGTPEF